MTNERSQPDNADPSGRNDGDWIGRAVRFANVATIVACVAIAIAWAATSTFRGHLVEFALLLLPLVVNIVLLVLPRGKPLRDLSCLAVLAFSPVAIAYLMVETGAEYAAWRQSPVDHSSLQLLLWAADLLLWLYLLLTIVAIVNDKHVRTQSKLAKIDRALELKHDLLAKKHDAYAEAQARDKDSRIVGLEKAVAALQKRISERDGY